MLGLKEQQCPQSVPGLFLVVQNHVEPRQIQIGLIKLWSFENADLKLLFRVRVTLFPYEEDTQVVEGLRIIRT